MNQQQHRKSVDDDSMTYTGLHGASSHAAELLQLIGDCVNIRGMNEAVRGPLSILDALPAAIYITDARGRIAYFNPACVTLSGRVPVIGSDEWCVTWRLRHFDGRPMRHDECPMAVAIQEGRAIRGARAIAERPDGSRVSFEAWPTPLLDREGRVVGGVNMLVDVTPRLHLEQERESLLESERTAREQAEMLNALSRHCAGEHDLHSLLQAVTDGATKLTGAGFGAFFYKGVSGNGEDFCSYTVAGVSRETFAGFDLPRNSEVFDATFRGKSILRSDDITQDSRYGLNAPHNGMPAGHMPVRSYLAVPVIARSGEVYGGLFLGHPEPGIFTEAAERLASGIAAQASVAIENARLIESLRHSEIRLEAELADARLIHRISAALHRPDANIHEELLDSAIEIMAADFGSMQMLHPQRHQPGTAGKLQLLACRGLSPSAAQFCEWVSAESPLTCGQAIRAGKRVIIRDITKCPQLAGTEEQRTCLDAGIRAMQSTPLISRSGAIVGMISTHWRRVHEPSERDLRMLDILARQVADLIERNRANEALRRSEALYHQLLELLPVAVYSCEAPTGRITYFNSQAAQLWGRAPETNDRFCGSHAMFRPDGTPLPSAECPMAAAIFDGTSCRNVEVQVQRPDGSRIIALVSIDPIRDERGNILGAINVFVDATDQKRTEQALRDSEARFRHLADAMPQIVWTADADGRVDYFNDRWYEFSGFDRKDLDRERLLSILHPDDRQRRDELFSRSIQQGIPYQIEYRLKDSATGDYRWFIGRALPIRDEAGSIVKWFGTTTDIHDVKMAELANARLAAIVESSDDAIISKDLDGFITSWNRGAQALFGYTPEEVIGKHITLLIPPDHMDEEPRILERLRNGEAVDHFETVRRCKDGMLVDISLTVSPVRDVTGQIVGASKIARDITNRKLMENRIRQQAAAIADESRRKDEFLAMLSHELRNPLAPILSAVHLLRLRQHEAQDPVERQACEIIERQIGNLNKLVSDLLEVSRVVSGRIRLEQQVIDLRQVVQHAMQTVAHLVEQREHRLSAILDDEPVWTNADSTRIEEVVVNLLNNAAKYTPEGGRIEVHCHALSGENVAEVRIRDNGVGIDESLRPHLFELFTQSERSLDRSQGGLGIGLHLARRLVELHGGTIHVDSPPHGASTGSEFTVRLALAPDLEGLGRSSLPHSNGLHQFAGHRVLVVDDNIDLVTVLTLALRQRGYSVMNAYTGHDALLLARQWRPHAVLLDLGLPGLDGFEVARQLRTDPELGDAAENMCLIALSGYGRESDLEQARDSGFNAHMIKPCDFDKLEALIAAHTSAAQPLTVN